MTILVDNFIWPTRWLAFRSEVPRDECWRTASVFSCLPRYPVTRSVSWNDTPFSS